MSENKVIMDKWRNGYVDKLGSVDGPGIRFLIRRGCHSPLPVAGYLGYGVNSHVNGRWVMSDGRLLRYRGSGEIRVGLQSVGKALLQIDFLIALFTKAKEQRIHCTLDTFTFNITLQFDKLINPDLISWYQKSWTFGYLRQTNKTS